ncbi:MAG: DNA polymerase III subunit gamma/tau [Proteobacteria bacterium]|nr:DNA polymerase III subunit gamma/tau [Pseudomonadota bacterium]
MSYEVLARKYRPTNFEEVVGQDHIIKALSNSILQDRMHQAFIFSGTRGVGKTTLGRILAKCLNCLSSENPVNSPCDKCSNCEEIKLGRSLDFYEQDAASQRGIDAMKELLQTVPQSPSNGRYKVYLLDEAHMLTTESFNALLKNLEEPPKHVVFILATTNPEKLPKTVQSRCLQLNLKTVTESLLSNHLKKILNSENISFDDDSVDLISAAAEGSVRDALTLMDQAIAHGNGKLVSKDVMDLLGTIDNSNLFSMLDSIISGNGVKAFEIFAKVEELSPEYEMILKTIISILHQTSLEKVNETSKNTEKKNLNSPNPKENKPEFIAPNSTEKLQASKEKEESKISEVISSNQDWIILFNSLKLSPFARNYFGYLSFGSISDSILKLVTSDKTNKIPENVFKEFEKVLSEKIGKDLSIEVEIGKAEKSPIDFQNEIESDKKIEAEKDILSDPSIQKFLDKFNGNIKEGSIKPKN